MVCAASYREDRGPQTLFARWKKKNLCTLRKYEVKNYPSAQQRPISRNWILKGKVLMSSGRDQEVSWLWPWGMKGPYVQVQVRLAAFQLLQEAA